MRREPGVEERGAEFVRDDQVDESALTEFRFDVHQLQQMEEAGVFDNANSRRVILLEGKLYKMAPIGSPHGQGQSDLLFALASLIRTLGMGSDLIAVSASLTFGDDDAPTPDAMVLQKKADRFYYASENAKLLCEVSWSSLRKDLGPMKALYAGARIAEYWVQDMKRRELRVFRRPEHETYGSEETLKAGDHVSPLFAEGRGEIAVADLF